MINKLKKYLNKIFVKKGEFESCNQCNKSIQQHKLSALVKYCEELDTDFEVGDELDKKVFCSTECFEKYCRDNNVEEFDKKYLRRCSSYYDCLEIGNLRMMCEQAKDMYPITNPNYFSPIIAGSFCEPANAGLVKSSVNLHKQARKTAKYINIQFIITCILTILIILLTIINMVMVSNSETLVKFDVIIEQLKIWGIF